MALPKEWLVANIVAIMAPTLLTRTLPARYTGSVQFTATREFGIQPNTKGSEPLLAPAPASAQQAWGEVVTRDVTGWLEDAMANQTVIDTRLTIVEHDLA